MSLFVLLKRVVMRRTSWRLDLCSMKSAAFALKCLLAGFALFTLAGCDDFTNRFVLVSTESVANKPYLLVAKGPMAQSDAESVFTIYRGTSMDGSAWQEVVSDRLGPVFGTCVYSGSGPEALVVFHPRRVSFFRFEEPPFRTEHRNLSFDWDPETGAQLGGALYVFGGSFRDAIEAEDGSVTGAVTVARYEGEQFEELKIGNAPRIRFMRPGFWMKAAYHNGRIHLFWRSAQGSGGMDMEPPLNLTGPLKTVSFDGKAFDGPVREITDLPRGFMDIWSDGHRLGVVVQPQDSTFGRTASLRLFTLSEDDVALESILEKPAQPLRLRMKHFDVVRVPVQEQDVFLRTNSQTFELWWPGAGGWMIGPQPTGLPQNQWESFLFLLFALCVLTVAGGLGLAYRRRQHVLFWIGELHPKDVIAPLSLRICAYLIDLFIICLTAELIPRLLGAPGGGVVINLYAFIIPSPYFIMYMLYLSLCEGSLGFTAGKLIMGLRVVTNKGTRPTIWTAMVRNLIGFFERHPLLAGFAALPTILLTPRHQRLGDLLARTVVVQNAAMERFCFERVMAEERRQDEEKRTDRRDHECLGKDEVVEEAPPEEEKPEVRPSDHDSEEKA